jgi:hypothetical protein
MDHSQAHDSATQLSERANELAKLLGDLAEQPEERAVERVRDAEREVEVLLERLHGQMEEFLPAEPMERIYERVGATAASSSDFEAFAAEHAIPFEEG